MYQKLTPNVRLKLPSDARTDIIPCCPQKLSLYLDFKDSTTVFELFYWTNSFISDHNIQFTLPATCSVCYRTPCNRPLMSSRRSNSMEEDNIRKRVCKACDRCRLKKSKVCFSPKVLHSMSNIFSATDLARAAGVRLTTPSAYSESERSLKIKFIQKGMFDNPTFRPSLTGVDTLRCLSNNKHSS